MDYDAPEFFDLMAYVADSDHDVIDMVSGNPDWGSPPAIQTALAEYAELGGEDFQYPPTEGLVELKSEIGYRHDVDPERIVITVGGGEANYLGIGLGLDWKPGTSVLLTDPVYPYFPGTVQMLGGRDTYVPTDNDGRLDPEIVEQHMNSDIAVVVVNTPNNPTGAVYDSHTMQQLAEIVEKYDAALVSDEAYDAFDFSGRFTSALEFNTTNTIVTKSFSKTMAITGFRVGYGIFPTTSLASAARDRHMLTLTAGVRPTQYAVLHALQTTEQQYYEECRAIMASRINIFTDALDSAGAEYMKPDGGFYVMTKFDGYPGTTENVKRLIDECGVAGMPGSGFSDNRRDWIRFALVTPRVEEAADRLRAYFAELSH